MKTYYIIHTAIGSTNLGNRTKHKIEGTYQDAVNFAHKIFQQFDKKIGVAVHSDENGLYYWHYIQANGKVIDRNTNSGVSYPTEYAIRYENGYRAA